MRDNSSVEKGVYVEEGLQSPSLKSDQDSVTLIPRPTNDPRDPLNWSAWKKYSILSVLVLSVFAAYSAPLAGQANVKQQSVLYHKSTTQITYSGSAAQAGLAVGGFFFNPIANKLGRPSIIFWTLLATLACQVWASQCTGKHDYNSYIVSRLFAGIFGASVGVIGPRMLVDMFFLHQRGRIFTAYHMGLNWGIVVGPTFSALFSAHTYWPVEYWWSVAILGFSALLVFFIVPETRFIREPGAINVDQPKNFLANRVATFFPGNRVMPSQPWSDVAKTFILPFQIGLSPVTVLLALYTVISFGWYPASNVLTPKYLQEPKKKGGYGFTVEENAYFTFNHWIGLTVGIFYGVLVSDRVPLAICARRGGLWKPEYRLHALWFPSLIVNPIGLGLFGASLQYELHWAVLAVAHFLVTFGSMAIIPISVNYICECFTKHPAEGAIILNFYRLAFGVTVPFYVDQWAEAVTIGWVWGMAAIFSAAAFGFAIILMFKGHEIRAHTISNLSTTEEGEKVVHSKHR